MAWLRRQDWFSGRFATFGMSYLGFVQWALAMDPPPELAAAVVQVGPHDFSRAAYHNGVLDLQNFLGWSYRPAHQETSRRPGRACGRWPPPTAAAPGAERAARRASGRNLLGTGAPWFEGWLEHPEVTDPFWAPLQCGAAMERIGVPTLLVGGWQDLFLEQTLEQYRVLSGRGVPTRLLVGPWTHVDVVTKGGAAMTESLAWLDRYAGPRGGREGRCPGHARPGRELRPRLGGRERHRRRLARGLRLAARGPREQRWHPGPDATLTASGPAPAGTPPARFRYDPADPTPSVGGATMTATAGVRDNRPLEARADVLAFTSEPLARPVEILGEVAAELSVARDNPYADLFVRLCDVTRGRSRNVCDGIVRLTAADPADGVRGSRCSVRPIASGRDTGSGSRSAGARTPASRATRARARSRRPRGIWCLRSTGSTWPPRLCCCRSPGEPVKYATKI